MKSVTMLLGNLKQFLNFEGKGNTTRGNRLHHSNNDIMLQIKSKSIKPVPQKIEVKIICLKKGQNRVGSCCTWRESHVVIGEPVSQELSHASWYRIALNNITYV